jgi:hypothetical protein
VAYPKGNGNSKRIICEIALLWGAKRQTAPLGALKTSSANEFSVDRSLTVASGSEVQVKYCADI